jgi:hypothetical protein
MTPPWQPGAEWWDDIAHDAFVCGELKGPAVQKLGSCCKSAVSRRGPPCVFPTAAVYRVGCQAGKVTAPSRVTISRAAPGLFSVTMPIPAG